MTPDRSDAPAMHDPIAPGLSNELDAARFRALAECPNIVMHGSSGVDAKLGGRLRPDQPGQVHFGAILNAPGPISASRVWGRHAILAIAQDVVHAEEGFIPPEALGESVIVDAERFRALLRLPRIRVISLKNAGIDQESPEADPLKPGRFTFTAEFWSTSHADASPQSDPALGRRCLVTLADDLIALSNDPTAQEEIRREREISADAVRAETERPHGMEQVVDTVERIAKRIPDASVSSVGRIQHQMAVVAEYMKLSNSLSVVPLPALRAVKSARTAAEMALRARIDEIVANARRLIDALPEDRRSRWVLSPIVSESDLLFSISTGASAVDYHFFKDRTKCEVLLDGGLVDHVASHSVSPEGDHLVVVGIGSWPLDDIVATSAGDGFAFLLANGQLIEIRPPA